jgi:hypothetical protein
MSFGEHGLKTSTVRRGLYALGQANQVAMALNRALGRGTSEMDEEEIIAHQEAVLAKAEAEMEAVLHLLRSFRVVVRLEQRRAALPAGASVRAERMLAQAAGAEGVSVPLAALPGRVRPEVVPPWDLRTGVPGRPAASTTVGTTSRWEPHAHLLSRDEPVMRTVTRAELGWDDGYDEEAFWGQPFWWERMMRHWYVRAARAFGRWLKRRLWPGG